MQVRVNRCVTQTSPADQRGGSERPCRGSVDVLGMLSEERRLLLQTARHSNVVNPEKATTCEGNIPGRVQWKHYAEDVEKSDGSHDTARATFQNIMIRVQVTATNKQTHKHLLT